VVEILEKREDGLEGWAIGSWGGRIVLGKPRPWHDILDDGTEVPSELATGDMRTFEPVFDATLAFMQGQQGPVQLTFVWPLLGRASIQCVHGVQVLYLVDDLSKGERMELSKCVQAAESILTQMRARQAGVAIPNGEAAKVLDRQAKRLFQGNGRR
jgi:hypothetical protein